MINKRTVRKAQVPSALSAIDVTNEEYGRCVLIGDFLEFLHDESAPLPTNEELEPLLARYILKLRRLGTDRLLAEGKISAVAHRKLTKKR